MGKFCMTSALLGGAIILAAAGGFVATYWWQGGEDYRVRAEPGKGSASGEEQDEGEEESAAASEAEAPGLSTQRWDFVETVGEEGALVEVAYDRERGWDVVGWRVKGIGLYGAPAFQVPARKWDDVPLFPCSDCHKKMEIDFTPRKMVEEHEDLVVNHANDRLWCTDCHGSKGMDTLTSRRGKPIDMDLSHLQCGECHFYELKDWEFGVHGRRIGLFAGVRVLRTCTECHNAHRPQILPDKPSPPPQFRANLIDFAPKSRRHPPVWERFSTGNAP